MNEATRRFLDAHTDPEQVEALWAWVNDAPAPHQGEAMMTPDAVYEKVADALGYVAARALSGEERLAADVAYRASREDAAAIIRDYHGPNPSPANPTWWAGYREARDDAARLAETGEVFVEPDEPMASLDKAGKAAKP